MKYFNCLALLIIALLSVVFQTLAAVNPNSTLINITQNEFVDNSTSSNNQCNTKEMEKFRVSVGKALIENKTRKIRNFVFEVNAVGIKFSLSFKASNNSQDLMKHCSTVKYYRENVIFLSRIFVLDYYGSKNANISQEKFRLTIKSELSADINQYINFKNKKTDKALKAEFLFKKGR